jgi:putative N-acetylmannosamine-6-phosphate epimerase
LRDTSARTLLAAAFSCRLTTGIDCVGTSIEGYWAALNTACADGDLTTMRELQPLLDCYVNGDGISAF